MMANKAVASDMYGTIQYIRGNWGTGNYAENEWKNGHISYCIEMKLHFLH